MASENIKNKIVSGLAWKFGERIIAQSISFVISVILARILSPSEYGIISLVLIFINFANVFITDGLGAPLIQKQDADEKDFSTMFLCSVVVSILLYILLFFISPLIASFYKQPQLTPVLRVMALQIPLSSVKTIQHAYVSKHMMFKKFFFSTLGGTIISGIIGIIMAINSFGVWALVAQYLINSVIDMTVLFFTVNWRPKLLFDSTSARSMCSYGTKLLGASLINTFYIECRSLIIGKVYSESDLAYNTKGNQFPALLISNINTSISSVLFPALSSVNDDISKIKIMTRRSLKISSYIIFPIMIGLMCISKPFILLLLSEQWLPCVPFLQFSCLYWMFQPCLTANNEALKACGRSDVCLKLEIIKKIIGFSLVLLTMNISVYALALSNALFACLSMLINMIPTKHIINYGFFEQFIDLLPNLIPAAFMGAIVYIISFINLAPILVVLIQVIVGMTIYLLTSLFTNNENFRYLKDNVINFMKKRKK